MTCPNTVPYRGKINRPGREQVLKQQSMVLWFTGLSGSSKSTIAHVMEERFHQLGRLTCLFDGENARRGLRLTAFISLLKEDCVIEFCNSEVASNNGRKP